MAQRTIYLPDDLDQAVTAYEISLSPLVQEAVRQELARRGVGPGSRQVGPTRSRKDEGVSSRGFDGITRGGGSGISRGWNSEREW